MNSYALYLVVNFGLLIWLDNCTWDWSGFDEILSYWLAL